MGGGEMSGAVVGFEVQGKGNNWAQHVQAHADDVTGLVEARAMHGLGAFGHLALLATSRSLPLVVGGIWRGPRLNLGCRVPDHPKPASSSTTSTLSGNN